MKTITVEPTRGRPAAAEAAAGEGGAAGAAGGSKPDVSRVSASPFSSLGSLGGSGVTVLGGGASLGLTLSVLTSGSSAKERAAAAARRVPSPERQPRKEKRKKVSWVGEQDLVGVRWFRKVRSRGLRGRA